MRPVRESVERLDADLVILLDGRRKIGLRLLKIGRAFVRSARCQQQRTEYEKPEMFHGFRFNLCNYILTWLRKDTIFF